MNDNLGRQKKLVEPDWTCGAQRRKQAFYDVFCNCMKLM